MSGSAEVLQEYLIKLGYKVDEASFKKFNTGLGTVGKTIFGVGTAVAGAVIAVESAAAAFAYSMRKVYFDSKLMDSSVKGIQSLEFAGKKFGISAQQMDSSIHGMAQALRLNPGLQGLVESFGIQVKGRDVSDVMKDYIKALDSMPEFQAAQYAGLFGMDPDTYHLMRGHVDELAQEAGKLKDVYRALGIDIDKTAKDSVEYANQLDDLKMHFGALETSILSHALPALSQFSSYLNHNMDIMTKWVNNPNRVSLWDALGWDHKKAVGGGVTATSESAARARALGPGWDSDFKRKAGAGGGTGSGAGGFGAIEEKYGLPSGLLSFVYKQESGKGKNLLSPKGAVGPFQFMPSTGKDWGLNNNEDLNDLGKSSNAAGGYLGSLMKKYNGNVDMALAAYNWGPNNLDKFGMGKLPNETKGYLSAHNQFENARLDGGGSGGVTVQQMNNNTFNVNGANASEVANKVAGAQTRVYADALRDGVGAVR